MRDYTQFSPTFWTRGSGKRLRGDAIAQVVAAYLSTSPGMNMIGIYYCPIDTIAHDTGLTMEQVRDALHRIERAGYAKYDHDGELAWVPNHAKIEIGEVLKPGDKRRARIIQELGRVDDHPFADEFVARYADSFTLPKGHPRTQEGASMGHPLVTLSQHGASGVLSPVGADQIRSDQIRSGPDHIGSASPPSEGGLAPLAVVGPKPSRRKPETPCPASDATPEVVAAWAASHGIPAAHAEFAHFLDHHRKADKRWRDWTAAWRTWLSNASKFSRAGPVARQPLGAAANAPWMKQADSFDFGGSK